MTNLAEVLLSAKKAERHPLEIVFIGFFYATLSLIISIWIFPEHSSLVMVFLTVISCIYVVQGALIIEEINEDSDNEEEWILKQHTKTIILLLCLFIGFLLAFVFWTVILSNESSSLIFNMQQNIINDIRNDRITGNSISNSAFLIIMENNLKVLLFSLILAVFYGAGAIFILAWNASIMGFAIGSLAKNTLGLSSLPLAFTGYLIHGIPEMLSYFIAALAGGIFFIRIIRNDFKKDKMKKTLIDLSLLIIISILILIIAALIEVYITPIIFNG